MFTATLLLVTQDRQLAETVRGVVEAVSNCELKVFARVDGAIDCLADEAVGLVVIHLAEGDDDSAVARLLREVIAAQQPVATLVIADAYDAERALAMLRLGVADYLRRPLDLTRLAFLVDMLTARIRLKGPSARAQPEQSSLQRLGERSSFVYHPGEMGRLLDQVRKVAGQDTDILLSGETGTGKTRLAGLIHELSPRRDKPFLVVNCAALVDSLIESELFGHCKGAFTGADRNRVGKFAAVGEGTLLLDDVEALGPNAQAKLLRVIDERVFEPVGSNSSQRVKARLIVTSNRSLADEVAAGRFRIDLYYRLNTVEFHLPPLRVRHSEIVGIAEHFLAESASGNGRKIAGLSPDVVQALEQHDWPGNVRELKHVIERCVTLCSGSYIRVEDLPQELQSVSSGTESARSSAQKLSRNMVSRQEQSASLKTNTLRSDNGNATSSFSLPHLSALANARIQAEISRILEALETHGNNRLRAARELGISRTALYKKLHKYGLMDTP